MTIDPSRLGLYMGIAFSCIFVLFTFYKYKKAPEFLEMAIIILSCTGVTVGLHLGYVVLTISDVELGKLAEHRVPVVLGALAVVWTSIASLINTCAQALRNINGR